MGRYLLPHIAGRKPAGTISAELPAKTVVRLVYTQTVRACQTAGIEDAWVLHKWAGPD